MGLAHTLGRTAKHYKYCNTMQCIATNCSTLQSIAKHCNVLQRSTTHYDALQHTAIQIVCPHRAQVLSVLQCVTVSATECVFNALLRLRFYSPSLCLSPTHSLSLPALAWRHSLKHNRRVMYM